MRQIENQKDRGVGKVRRRAIVVGAVLAAIGLPALSAYAAEIKDSTTGLNLFDVGTAGENTSASLLAVSNGGSASSWLVAISNGGAASNFECLFLLCDEPAGVAVSTTGGASGGSESISASATGPAVGGGALTRTVTASGNTAVSVLGDASSSNGVAVSGTGNPAGGGTNLSPHQVPVCGTVPNCVDQVAQIVSVYSTRVPISP